jgi:hypothetical protein
MTCDAESPRVGSPVDAHAARREILGEFPLALVRDAQRVDASLRLPHADRPVLLDQSRRLCRAHPHVVVERRSRRREYPETGKIGIITDGKTWEFFRRDDAAEHPL